MADEDDEANEDEDEDEDENRKDSSKGLGGKKKLILLISAVLLLVLLITGGLYLSGFFDSSPVTEESEVDEKNLDDEKVEEAGDAEQSLKETSVEITGENEGTEPKKAIIDKGLFYHKFEDLNVNLISSKRKRRFFRLSLTVALTKEEDVLVLETLSPRVTGNVMQYLRGLRPIELAGSANFNRVQDNILLRVRAAVAPVVVTDALITLALVK
jgi:flagellar FliL protein|tara:strand:+ start:15 stop:653 length:639 start_codon:yes stop_codon:yes gene_type:complete